VRPEGANYLWTKNQASNVCAKRPHSFGYTVERRLWVSSGERADNVLAPACRLPHRRDLFCDARLGRLCGRGVANRCHKCSNILTDRLRHMDARRSLSSVPHVSSSEPAARVVRSPVGRKTLNTIVFSQSARGRVASLVENWRSRNLLMLNPMTGGWRRRRRLRMQYNGPLRHPRAPGLPLAGIRVRHP
jgi:hypothetical protein